MTPPSLEYAAVALAGLTLFVYLMLTIVGVAASASGKLSQEYARTKQGAPPPDGVANWGRNLANLFELPVLFYVLVALHLARPGTADGLQLWLAWAFVASRFLHTLVQVTINAVGLRFLIHRLGFAILVALWVRLALAL